MYDYDFLTVVGNVEGRQYVGIVSCLFDGISSDSAGSIFAERGISVRTGLQCAPKAHRFLGTYPAGTIRLSVNALTNEKDFEELKDALDDIETKL
ncbi:MAG: aminotransferase class V-fold PLP-dependent enzyme [[Eubacterium] siraeum]